MHSTFSFNSNMPNTVTGSGDTRVRETDRTLTSESQIPVEDTSYSRHSCGEEMQGRKASRRCGQGGPHGETVFEQRSDREEGANHMDTEGLVLTDSTSEAHACKLGTLAAGAVGRESHTAPVSWETLQGSGKVTRPASCFTGILPAAVLRGEVGRSSELHWTQWQ